MAEQPHAAHGDHHAHGAHDDHGHGHGHGSPFIQHHYDDAQHQFDSGKLGIWLFLAQEVLFFSALFVAYVVYRYHHPELWDYAHRYLDTKMGAINTAVLIFSSLTAAWAVRCAQLNQRRGLIACLSITIACAFGFLVIKYIEYTHKIHEHILFGTHFDPCISSGGRPLLTKNNECPGSESSVIWDKGSNAPVEGCFDSEALDRDPKKDGVQFVPAQGGAPSCKVFEAQGSYQTKTDPATKKTATVWVETKRTEITKQCPEWTAQQSHEGGHGAGGQACWRSSYQPDVCSIGWSYRWTCTGTCAPGDAFGSQGPFQSQKECENAANRKKKDLDAAGGQTTISTCSQGEMVGFLIEYPDDQIRSNVRVEAQCSEKEAEPQVADPLADQQQTFSTGQGQVATPATQTKLSKHDAKEAVYAGPPPEHTSMFFTIYFAMTGLHGIHVLVGIFIFIWLLIRAIKGQFTPDYFGPVDFAALYWHIVDLIWIFLFPLLYLIH